MKDLLLTPATINDERLAYPAQIDGCILVLFDIENMGKPFLDRLIKAVRHANETVVILVPTQKKKNLGWRRIDSVFIVDAPYQPGSNAADFVLTASGGFLAAKTNATQIVVYSADRDMEYFNETLRYLGIPLDSVRYRCLPLIKNGRWIDSCAEIKRTGESEVLSKFHRRKLLQAMLGLWPGDDCKPRRIKTILAELEKQEFPMSLFSSEGVLLESKNQRIKVAKSLAHIIRNEVTPCSTVTKKTTNDQTLVYIQLKRPLSKLEWA